MLLAGCNPYYYVDYPDIDLEEPLDLEKRLSAFRSGNEPWHNDPKEVADRGLRAHVDVPWKYQSFNSEDYEVRWSQEWGTFVVRGFSYSDARGIRYRVKLRPYQEIWYPVQVSRFLRVVRPDDEHEH